jgi:Spy/CpxP family protein refolding chaperone
MEKSFEQEKEELALGMKESNHQTEVRTEMSKIREEGIIKEDSVTDTHKVINEAEKRISDRKKNEVLRLLEKNKITNFYSPEDQIKLNLAKAKEKEKND